MKFIILAGQTLLFLLLLVISVKETTSSAVHHTTNNNTNTKTNDNNSKLLVGYYASWLKGYSVADIPWPQLTHVLYAFAGINPDGSISLPDPEGASADFLECARIKSLYPASSARLLLSVGGWGLSQGFSQMCRDPVKRRRFVGSASELLLQYRLDGLDLDWEFPVEGGQAGPFAQSPQDLVNYKLLMLELREYWRERAEMKGFLMSVAAPSSPTAYRHWMPHIKEIARVVDFVSLMTYEFSGPWSSRTQHASNLYHKNAPQSPSPSPSVNSTFSSSSLSSTITTEASVNSVIKVLSDYRYSLGYDRALCKKLLIGIPLFARFFYNTKGFNQRTFGNSEQNSLFNLNQLVSNPENNVTSIKVNVKSDETVQISYSREFGANFAYSGERRTFISLDWEDSLLSKVRMVKALGLGGIMFWELSGDFYPSASSQNQGKGKSF